MTLAEIFSTDWISPRFSPAECLCASLGPLSAFWQTSVLSRERIFHQISHRNYASLSQTWKNVLIVWDISSKKRQYSKHEILSWSSFCSMSFFRSWAFNMSIWICPMNTYYSGRRKVPRFLKLEGKQKNNTLHGLEIVVKEEWILQSGSVTKMCFVHLRRVSVLFEKKVMFSYTIH